MKHIEYVGPGQRREFTARDLSIALGEEDLDEGLVFDKGTPVEVKNAWAQKLVNSGEFQEVDMATQAQPTETGGTPGTGSGTTTAQPTETGTGTSAPASGSESGDSTSTDKGSSKGSEKSSKASK